ncbi:MAG: signal peptidase I [Hahellaceae bacterium]|jgi:signal peptidase I|nr:signal peptidase I [Hahellaceae bacterium]
MNFDFSLILVIATLVTGAVWLIDTLLFAKARQQAAQQEEAAVRLPLLVEYSRSFFPVLFIVLIVRSFLVEPFQIPSQSMVPTLEVGDFILVNKFQYGLRLPVLGHKFVDIDDPKRGDVMVFRNPEDNVTNYIKRVVGLPGDRISYVNKQLLINGEPVSERLVAALPAGRPMEYFFEETLGENTHRIIKLNADNKMGEGEFIVPEGQYFMMGDNRDRSKDSRFIGFVPDKNIVGHAFAIWMHWESFFSIPSFSRVGKID